MKTNYSFLCMLGSFFTLALFMNIVNANPVIMSGYCKDKFEKNPKIYIITNMKFYQDGEVRMTNSINGALDYERVKHTDDVDEVRTMISKAKADFLNKGGSIGSSDINQGIIYGASFLYSSGTLIKLVREPKIANDEKAQDENWKYIISTSSSDQSPKEINLLCKIVQYKIPTASDSTASITSNQEANTSEGKGERN